MRPENKKEYSTIDQFSPFFSMSLALAFPRVSSVIFPLGGMLFGFSATFSGIVLFTFAKRKIDKQINSIIKKPMLNMMA